MGEHQKNSDNKAKEEFGFGKARCLMTGSSPPTPSTLAFFEALGAPIRESYGSTENTGAAVVARGAGAGCGKALTGTEIKIDNPDKQGNGEVSGVCEGSNL